jgi:hypothetical protein
LKSVGPNATLVEDDIEAVVRGLKARLVGEIEVAGPDLARSLTDLGLIDEYRLYLHPVVLGRGKPFFAGPRPPLRLVASDLIGEDVIKFRTLDMGLGVEPLRWWVGNESPSTKGYGLAAARRLTRSSW